MALNIESYFMGMKSPAAGGGTRDYADLRNKPQIDGVTLSGNKTAADLGLVVREAGKGLSANDFTDADALALETAREKSNSAFSAIDDLLTGLQVPVYKRFISYGSFRLNSVSGGRLDDFHVATSMAGQTVCVALYRDFLISKDAEGKTEIASGNPDVKTAVVGADGGLDVTFSRVPGDFFIVATTTDLASHYANENRGAVEFTKILFTCRYTRNAGVFMGLDDMPAVSMDDFADRLGYSLWYEEITDMTPEAVVTTTADAVFLCDGSEYYELAATKPSEIPNQGAVYYRCLYRRKDL